MKNIDELISSFDKKYGKGSVLSSGNLPDVAKIPTGVLSLDVSSGGGYGLGRIVEVYGPESVGKTTLAIYGMISAQKAFPDKHVGIVDAEHAFDMDYAEKLGLNKDKVLISQPSHGEEALNIVSDLASSNLISFILVDSVAALIPKAELDGEMEDNQIGLQARMMSKAMRKITGDVNMSKTVLMFINQTRTKIGVMFGDPTTTTGGNALKFFASQRIELSRSQGAKNDDATLASNKVKAKVVKNKLGIPFKVAEYELVFGEGISRSQMIVDLGEKTGLIIRSGSWYSLASDGIKLGQGAPAAAKMLADNPELMDALEEAIKEAYAS